MTGIQRLNRALLGTLTKSPETAAIIADRLEEIERDAAEARADTTRMDWLERNLSVIGWSVGNGGSNPWFIRPSMLHFSTCREAIDAAMREANAARETPRKKGSDGN